MTNLELPDDLVAFLKEGRQLEYNPTRCEIGRATLLPLAQLKLELFGVSTQSSVVEKEDPCSGQGGCYLVDGVSLLASCQGYDPEGMLLWLPRERRYATWDSSHLGIHVFPPETTWLDIAADLPGYVNRQWGNWTREQTLIPWPRYVHVEKVPRKGRIPPEDIAAIKGLIERIGAERLQILIDLLEE